MEFAYRPNKFKFFSGLLIILSTLLFLLLNPYTRVPLVKALLFQEFSSYSVVVFAFFYMIYRGVWVWIKFTKIIVNDQHICFPQFPFYYKEYKIPLSEINDLRIRKNLGGAIISSRNGNYLIRSGYFEKNQFEEFLTEITKKIHKS